MAIEEVVRQGESPQKSRGFNAQTPKGGSGADPVADVGGNRAPQAPPYLRQNSANDADRWPQTNFAFANGEELISQPVKVSGAFEVDPNLLNLWDLTVYGTSVTITFAPFNALNERLTSSIWNGARRVRTLQLRFNWQNAGLKTVTMTGVIWGDSGTMPDWTNAAGSLDVVQIAIDSAGRKLGFVAGLDMKAPS